MTDAVAPEETGSFGTSIAASVKRCLRSFDDLHQELHRATNKFSSEISISDVDDETGRFRVWAGNIGAHQMGLRSLDYRLRDASHIKSRVQSLLQDLYRILRDARSIVSGEKTPWDKVLLGSDSASSDSESSGEDPDDDTELRQLAVSIRKRVTLLLRVSMSIRNPAAHDQLRRSVNIDTSCYEQFDIGHVQNKFPNAPKALVVNLGKAISRRRLYFKYRESHAKKLSFSITRQDGDAGTEPQPQSTVASSLPQNVKEDTVLDIEAEEKQSESGFTQTSFATSANEMSNQGLKIPPLPKQAEGGSPFECPFCFMIISISTRRTWKKHVYQDLLPYVCTFPECTASNSGFSRRHEWFQHEQQMHRRSWQCINGCSRFFSTQSDFEDHVSKEHKEMSSPEQLAGLLKTCGTTGQPHSRTSCHLCGLQDISFLQLEKHLGEHQRQLALFALPSAPEGGEEDDSCVEMPSVPASLSDAPPNVSSASPPALSGIISQQDEDPGASLPSGWEIEHEMSYSGSYIESTAAWDDPSTQPMDQRASVSVIAEREANETVIANWLQTRKPQKRPTDNINDLEDRLTEKGSKAVKGNITDRYLDSQLQEHERNYSQAGVFTDEDAGTIEVLHGTVLPGQTQAEDLGAKQIQYGRRQASAIDADVTEFVRGSPQIFGNAATKPPAVPHHSIMPTSSHLKSAGPRKEHVVSFVKDGSTGVSRPSNIAESWALYDFEMHARICATCRNPYDVHRSGRQLCDEGYRLALQVAHFLYMKRDGEAYSTEEEAHQIVRVEIPPSYEEARGLLRAIEHGIRHRRPFLSMDRKVPDIAPRLPERSKNHQKQGKPVIKVEQTPHPPPRPKKSVE